MHDYRKLDVWVKSHELAVDLHRLAASSATGATGLTGAHGATGATGTPGAHAELRRAALAVPVLLVRGCEAESAGEFAAALREAAAAVDELGYRLRFARDAEGLEAVAFARLEARVNQLRAMLGGLNRTVRIKLGAAARPARSRATARDAGSSPRRSPA
jgi:four helix bundle protein